MRSAGSSPDRRGSDAPCSVFAGEGADLLPWFIDRYHALFAAQQRIVDVTGRSDRRQTVGDARDVLEHPAAHPNDRDIARPQVLVRTVYDRPHRFLARDVLE